MSDYTPDFIPLKCCSKCKERKPATTEYFSRRSSQKDGLCYYCKECNNANARQWGAANREQKRQSDREAYKANPEPYKENARRWRKANPERRRENNQKWSEANREKERERGRKYYKANQERERERSRKKYVADRERYQERGRKWAAANPEKKREYARKHKQANPEKGRATTNRRNARKRSLPDTLTTEQWQACLDYFSGCCAYCGRPAGLFHVISLDHFIPLSSPDCPGTTVLNCLPACHYSNGCNSSKQDKHPHTWLTSKFGSRRASSILRRINAYFDSLKAPPNP